MNRLVVACSGAKHIGKKIANYANAKYTELFVDKFPDNELHIRFLENLKGKKVYLVQSFFDNINEKILEILFAGYTAKDLKAKKVILIALYLPYLRQDRRFNHGDCISAEVIAKLLKIFDKIYVVEPHLHRIKDIKQLMKNAEKISVVETIAEFIKKLNLKDCLLIGPDVESYQWAKYVARILNKEVIILKKKRLSPRKVKIRIPKLDVFARNVVIVDDIISTGHTMLETIKGLLKLKPKRIYCIAIHGIFAKDALKKLQKYATVYTCNTIPNKVSKINIAEDVAKVIK